MKKMNIIELSINLYYAPMQCRDDEGNTHPHVLIAEPIIWIDKIPLNASRATPIISLNSLYASQFMGGDFYILTYGSDVPGCAKIEDGILISHTTQSVKWTFPAEYNEHLKAQGLRIHAMKLSTFEFDRTAYIQAVTQAIAMADILREDLRAIRFNETSIKNGGISVKASAEHYLNLIADGKRGHSPINSHGCACD